MDLYSRKSCIILAMCLSLYILLSALLLFYVEECTEERRDTSSKERVALKTDCIKTLETALHKTKSNNNGSAYYCEEIVAKIYDSRFYKKRQPNCQFTPRNYFTWVHRVTFSLLTIGGGEIPISVGGKLLLIAIIITGMFPAVRFFIHCGTMTNQATEKMILCFEVKVLNRSSRMIHSICKKVIFIQGLAIFIYNIIVAKVTSLELYQTQWTYLDSLLFWLCGMTTTGQKLNAIQNDEFFSNGGWRILCLDVMMIVNIILVSGLVCSVVQIVHKKACPAAETIRYAFKTQNPEVYMHIKPLKSHL